MISFWIIAVLLTVATFAILLPPLFGRGLPKEIARDDANLAIHRQRQEELESDLANDLISQEEFDQAKEELERELLADMGNIESLPAEGHQRSGRVTALIVALFIPVLAFPLYAELGSWQKIGYQPPPPPPQQPAIDIDEMTAKLAAKLKTDPDNLQGWSMMARTYEVQKRWTDAIKAHRNIVRLAPDDAMAKVGLAVAILQEQRGVFNKEVTDLLEQAAKLDANNPDVLFMFGQAKFTTGEYEQAIAFWNKLLPLLDNDPQSKEFVGTMIEKAKAKLNSGSSK